MIRRDPTRIAISQLEVEELIASRKRSKQQSQPQPQSGETSTSAAQPPAADTDKGHAATSTAQQRGAGQPPAEHPADVRARERLQMSNAERLGAEERATGTSGR